jgi:hypothetical protein
MWSGSTDIPKIYEEDIWLSITLRQLYNISHALDAHIASGEGDDDEKKMLQIIHDFLLKQEQWQSIV